MAAGMETMLGDDLKNRVNRWNTRENLGSVVHQITEGEIYDEVGVKVTAFAVSHADGNPAFGYRIPYHGKNIVLSGDTTYVESVVKGSHADLLVHHVIAADRPNAASPEIRKILAKLTRPEQAAPVFERAKPKMAVYSHIAKKAMPGLGGDLGIMKRTHAAGYEGPLEMGYDRITIQIGDAGDVRVLRPETIDDLPDMEFKEVASAEGKYQERAHIKDAA